ncbi:hypothetical protein F503_05818 [Ophiostoma piceae UAMH 11346]|uniref:Uncharacterized protein n=1 Tax=Ophiostoma piceae (strain UAMH 11346) TaxID=1262450 RepID=S3CVK8_OPHP1|nr:hypothetical protein F503_05818 [Ophiostoma piceae UAMH 11346]
MSAPPKDVDPSKLTERETRFFICAIQSLRGGEQRIDYDRLSSAIGTTPKGSMNTWCNLKKKFELSFGSASSAGAASTKAPAKPRKRKAAAQLVKAEAAGSEANECVASAAKGSKKAKTAKTAKTASDESTDEDYKEEDDSV